MRIFRNLISLFHKSVPVRDLQDNYSLLKELGEELHKRIVALRKIYSRLVKEKIAFGKGSSTGGLSIQKTLFLEETFLPELKELISYASQRFQKAADNLKANEPISEVERSEIERITSYFEKTLNALPDLSDLSKKSRDEQLLEISSAMKVLDGFWKNYLKTQEEERKLIQEVIERELNPVLQRVFFESTMQKFSQKSRTVKILAASVSKRELRELEREAVKLKICNDPNFSINWRQWWRPHQIPERDATIPLPPHVNVRIRYGGKEKEIHLLVA